VNRRPTPETDALAAEHRGAVIWPDFARRLERERDEARADLEFRRGLFKLQEQQLNEVRVENERLKRLATWPHDTDPFTSPDHDNDSNIYS
jgi:hypothetical protein